MDGVLRRREDANEASPCNGKNQDLLNFPRRMAQDGKCRYASRFKFTLSVPAPRSRPPDNLIHNLSERLS